MDKIEQEIIALQIEHDWRDGKPGRGYKVYGENEAVPPGWPVVSATKIEAIDKNGLHCGIPYYRVWLDDECLGEFCAHNIVGVYFRTNDHESRQPAEVGAAFLS